MALSNEQLITELSAKSVIEIAELVKQLEEKWGVSAAAPVMVAGAAAGGAPAEEKTAFDIILVDGGANKINVIKAVKELTGLGLADAKALVDGAPKMVKEGVKKEDAEAMIKKIEEAGGKVTLK